MMIRPQMMSTTTAAMFGHDQYQHHKSFKINGCHR